jgi:DNA polymerase III subunit delta'
MMLINNNRNNNLYGLNKYFFELSNLYDKNKLPNKILLSGKKGLGKSTLAFHLVNYILSKNQEYAYDKDNYVINKLNKSFLLTKNNTHPNFFLIDVLKDKKNIEINQIRELIAYLNKSSFNNTPRLILIDNIEFLNKNSTNAILKILEEPNSNVFFILINNNKKILSTLSSRCLNFKINLPFNDVLDISNKILNKNILDYINIDLINYYNTPGDYYNLFEFANKNKINLLNFDLCQFLNYIIDNNLFKKDLIAKKITYNYIELFFLKKYFNSNVKKFILEFYYSFIKKVKNCNQFNLDEESLFMEFKSKILNG